jgi:hypothetical protein
MLPSCALPPPPPPSSHEKHPSTNQKNKKQMNDFENASESELTLTSCYGGEDLVAVISDVVLGMAEIPGYPPSSIREVVLNTLVASRSALQTLGYLSIETNQDEKMTKRRSASEEIKTNSSRSAIEDFVMVLIKKFGTNHTKAAPVRLYTSTSSVESDPGVDSGGGASAERLALAMVRSKPIHEVLSPAHGLTSVASIMDSLSYRLNAAQELALEESADLVNLFDDFGVSESNQEGEIDGIGSE